MVNLKNKIKHKSKERTKKFELQIRSTYTVHVHNVSIYTIYNKTKALKVGRWQQICDPLQKVFISFILGFLFLHMN